MKVTISKMQKIVQSLTAQKLILSWFGNIHSDSQRGFKVKVGNIVKLETHGGWSTKTTRKKLQSFYELQICCFCKAFPLKWMYSNLLPAFVKILAQQKLTSPELSLDLWFFFHNFFLYIKRIIYNSYHTWHA